MGKIELIFEEAENEVRVYFGSLDAEKIVYAKKAIGYGEADTVPYQVRLMEFALNEIGEAMANVYEADKIAEMMPEIKSDAVTVSNLV